MYVMKNPGQTAYKGSRKNGIESQDYSEWSPSFVVTEGLPNIGSSSSSSPPNQQLSPNQPNSSNQPTGINQQPGSYQPPGADTNIQPGVGQQPGVNQPPTANDQYKENQGINQEPVIRLPELSDAPGTN